MMIIYYILRGMQMRKRSTRSRCVPPTGAAVLDTEHMNGFGNFGSNKPANVRHVTQKIRKRPAPRVRVAGVQRNVFQLVIRFYKI